MRELISRSKRQGERELNNPKNPLTAVLLAALFGPFALVYVGKRSFGVAVIEYILLLFLTYITAGLAGILGIIYYIRRSYLEAKKIEDRYKVQIQETREGKLKVIQSATQKDVLVGEASTASLCPKCQANIRSGARFCPSCGEPLAKICPNCNSQLTVSAKFCGHCGARVERVG